jgi:hypothetical protein
MTQVPLLRMILTGRGVIGDYSNGYTTADGYARGPFTYCRWFSTRRIQASLRNRIDYLLGTYSWYTLIRTYINSGHQIGIIANQTPIIFTKESQKAVQFIRLCNQSSTPILFMHNVTGFMVGKKTEREGLIKSGSLFVDAVSRSQVPHLSIICGASYGAGNYAVFLA